MQLPVNRIRQIINLDPESQMITKEALMVICKATEAFVQDLGGVCAQIAKTQKRKTLLLQDLQFATSQIDKFHFIKDSKLPSLKAGGHHQQSQSRTTTASKATAA